MSSVVFFCFLETTVKSSPRLISSALLLSFDGTFEGSSPDYKKQVKKWFKTLEKHLILEATECTHT